MKHELTDPFQAGARLEIELRTVLPSGEVHSVMKATMRVEAVPENGPEAVVIVPVTVTCHLSDRDGQLSEAAAICAQVYAGAAEMTKQAAGNPPTRVTGGNGGPRRVPDA